MKGIRDWMKGKENTTSLERFLSLFDSKRLTEEEAKEKITRGIVEIVYLNGDHCANGLLIGEGYFVTTKHIFKTGASNKRIVDYQNRKFEVQSQVFCAKKTDLALARFKRPQEEFPGYNFSSLENIAQLLPSVLIGRDNGKEYRKGCLPTHAKIQRNIVSEKVFRNNILPMYCFSMNSGKNGDSGGVFATANGDILGFMRGSWPGEETKWVYGVKSEYLASLINAYLKK